MSSELYRATVTRIDDDNRPRVAVSALGLAETGPLDSVVPAVELAAGDRVVVATLAGAAGMVVLGRLE